MNGYHLALFLHLCALLGAIAVSALLHMTESRMRAASTLGEVRGCMTTIGRTTKGFPVASVVLVATGLYMMHGVWPWRMGWIEVGLSGIVLLVAMGGTVARRGRVLERALERAGDGPVTDEIAQLVRDPIARTLTWVNTMLGIGIVYIMVMKTSLAGSIVAVVIAMLIGAGVAQLVRRADRKELAVSN